MVKAKKNEELVSDPRELLLSLVDMGSLDIEDALMACVKEMSDAECKRVLSGLSLPDCCDMDDDVEASVEAPNLDDFGDEDMGDDMDMEAIPEEDASDDADDEEVDEENEDMEEDDAELEARVRRLENALKNETMNRNRVRRFPHRKTDR